MDNVISRIKVEALIRSANRIDQNHTYASFIGSYKIREVRPGYVSIFDYIGIWKKLMANSGDPLLPCKIGEHVHISDLGVPGLISMHSENLGLALKSAVMYDRLMSDCFLLTSVINGSEVKVSLSAKKLDVEFDWHHVFLKLFSQFAKIANFLTNNLYSEDIGIIRVGFSRDIEGLEDLYSDYFRCPVYGSQSEDYFVISARVLDLPVHNPQKDLFELFTNIANRSLESLNHKTYSDRVLRILEGYKHPAMARVDAVSQELNLSVATLKRKLQSEDTSFSMLKDLFLLSETQKILDLGYSSSSYVAERLGYSDASSFSKAFRRWTGGKVEDYIKSKSKEAPLSSD
ncbi:AraC family transcriptional regulator [Microbulbifer zhoushanensis]|uniref:AraC family transcriptional regulator n=1 Tax=Microbulbifer zhoushanensis TaxID=2904254 RepID=UPI001F39D071|nr:AraC family transcriptional regulator [Microbulbifer zhoushanensis]